jgi:hypothetical protein
MDVMTKMEEWKKRVLSGLATIAAANPTGVVTKEAMQAITSSASASAAKRKRPSDS